MYFTWASIESWSSLGREEEVGGPARPGPDTNDMVDVEGLGMEEREEGRKWSTDRMAVPDGNEIWWPMGSEVSLVELHVFCKALPRLDKSK